MQKDRLEQQKRMGRLARVHGGKVQNRALRNPWCGRRSAVRTSEPGLLLTPPDNASETGDDYLGVEQLHRGCRNPDDCRSGAPREGNVWS
jgi:hypothetical protein